MKNILVLLLFISCISYGQMNLRDSSISTLLIGINYHANFTDGDLAERWGFNNQIGLDFDYKFKNNLSIGGSAGFLFGSEFKEPEIFLNVINSYGTITGLSGEPANVLFLMRGAMSFFNVGYVFNRLGNNANSGLWIKVGGGFMGHKIRIESLYDDIPQLEGDYRKGYDKLTMGIATNQFVGYLFQADRKLLKFYGGVQFSQGFTQNVRTYNFDSGGQEPAKRVDLIHSVKVGWIIPIYKRSRSQYYYN